MKQHTGYARAFRRLMVVFGVGMAIPVIASAQAFELGGGLVVGVPTGEFADTLDKAGYGAALHFGYQFEGTPLMLGIGGTFLTYGNESRNEPWSNTIPDVTVKVETSHNIAIGNVFLRLIPETGMIRPYVDGFVGVNYLFTSTSVENKGGGEENIASSTNHDDAAFAYGTGGGVMVRVYENPRYRSGSGEITRDGGEESSIGEALIDLRVGYANGGNANYLTNGSVHRDAGRVTYDVKHSTTDMLSARLGVVVRF